MLPIRPIRLIGPIRPIRPIGLGGFTLIEVLVVSSLLVVVVVIATGFLFASLSSSGKAEVTKEVRQNGSYALSVIESLILSSRSVNCPAEGGGKEIEVTNNEGFVAIFLCDEDSGKISSNGANLTGSSVFVSNCLFVCEKEEGKPTRVNLGFDVRQKSSVTLRPAEKANMSFSSSVVTKNY